LQEHQRQQKPSGRPLSPLPVESHLDRSPFTILPDDDGLFQSSNFGPSTYWTPLIDVCLVGDDQSYKAGPYPYGAKP